MDAFNSHEIKNVLRLLGFYVYEPVQYRVIIKDMFDYVLSFEKINAEVLVYNNPTLQLTNFLKRITFTKLY